MILGPVSYLDCVVFCIFLAPQLVWQVGLFETVFCVLQCLPFLAFQLPLSFLYERYLVSRENRSPFVRRASPFEDAVVRCVRYAFANIPPRIGRVFFSKQVALPFLRFRMIRHGYLRCPIHWHEYRGRTFSGVWVIRDPLQRPDLVLYYAHGGGFAMGSTYFYLEFLLSWLSVLEESGYKNPAIFGLEYTLVPDACFPTQLREVVHGYEHVLSVTGDPSLVCVGGDSAGAALILSLLMHLANRGKSPADNLAGSKVLPKPRLAALISPWTTLLSPSLRNTASDYLDARALHRYGLQYAGPKVSSSDPLVSPGSCRDASWWRDASPVEGIFITYGEEEIFAPEIKELTRVLEKGGVLIGSVGEVGDIHAWPVVSLFLSSSTEQRLKGLRTLSEQIRKRMA